MKQILAGVGGDPSSGNSLGSPCPLGPFHELDSAAPVKCRICDLHFGNADCDADQPVIVQIKEIGFFHGSLFWSWKMSDF